ncbi:MAG TPA: cytochrome C oxidase subunit IV family protein [Acidimicrobiales bacterium]|nr:cytochrome C oxidase subunit IV family protein [Acidimicrobiales bacterium]
MTDVVEEKRQEQQEASPPDHDGEHRGHPSDAQYILIALILAALTGIEVAVSYAKGLGYAGNPVLLILAASKFFIVVAFFMHLRFDSPILRRIFITGIVLAIVVYTVVFLTLEVFTSMHGVHG